jgi:hypothetical protein
LVEVTSGIVFDETNGSPRDKVDLDDIYEDEVPTAVMRTMAIGDVRPQEQEQDQSSSSTLVQPPTQDEEQVPQDEGMNQGGAHEEKDKEEEVPHAPLIQVGPPSKGIIQ